MSSDASSVEPFDAIEYPESDGEPMGETDVHRDEMVALIEGLKLRYRERADVYVAGNLFIYYEKGNPKACFAPDVFVVMGVEKKQRRIYKLWEERLVPSLVIEVSSKETWLTDTGDKKALCERLGVEEYILFDPQGDYLEPRLQGFQLGDGDYHRIAPDPEGRIRSSVLGMWLFADGHHLEAVDVHTGMPLPTLEREHDARIELQQENAELRRELDALRRRGR